MSGYSENFPCRFYFARLTFRCPDEASLFSFAQLDAIRAVPFFFRTFGILEVDHVSRLGWFVQFERSVFWHDFLETVCQPFPVNRPVSLLIKNSFFTFPVNLPVFLASVGNRLPFSIKQSRFSFFPLTDFRLSRIQRKRSNPSPRLSFPLLSAGFQVPTPSLSL